MEEKLKKYAVPALDKAFEILEYLAEHPIPLTQSELAKGLGRNANEIYRILVNLEEQGYLIRDSSSGRYRLSLKLYKLSRSISPVDQVRQCAIPHMEDLVVDIGLSCHLAMLYQSQTMVVVFARSHRSVSITINEGSTFSTLNTTSGNVLLAHSNDEVRAMILERESDYQSYSANQKQALFERLEQIKQTGQLTASNRVYKGLTDFSTIIGEPGGKVVAALTVSTMEELDGGVGDDRFDRIKQATIATAKRIRQQLGC